jgi:hypothetical protein
MPPYGYGEGHRTVKLPVPCPDDPDGIKTAMAYLLGGDVLAAFRHVHERNVEFKPTHNIGDRGCVGLGSEPCDITGMRKKTGDVCFMEEVE